MCLGECEIGGSKCTWGVEGSVNRTIHVFTRPDRLCCALAITFSQPRIEPREEEPTVSVSIGLVSVVS